MSKKSLLAKLKTTTSYFSRKMWTGDVMTCIKYYLNPNCLVSFPQPFWSEQQVSIKYKLTKQPKTSKHAKIKQNKQTNKTRKLFEMSR